MTHARDYLLLSALSGLAWGCLVTWIAASSGQGAIGLGGLIVSPGIGVIMGQATRPWSRLRTSLRIPAALFLLYAAAFLFGLAVGVYDWLTYDLPGRRPAAVVLQSIMAYLWGLTFAGWVLLFWPLAYWNHWLLGRFQTRDASP